MSKFNSPTKTPGPSAIRTENTPTAKTHEGAPAYALDLKSALFLLAVTNFVGEDTFYESAAERDARYANLVRQVAATDPVWINDFLTWLRSDANMRSAPLVGAIEAAIAMKEAGIPGARRIVNKVMQRADEPGEMIAYWRNKYGTDGRARLPMAIKRGIADAAVRLYSEYSLLKYDTPSHAVRFGDVIELTHPTPRASSITSDDRASWSESTVPARQARLTTVLRGQADLFKHAIDRRHDHANDVPDSLSTIRANAVLRTNAQSNPELMLDANALRAAGMTWEDALSLVGSKVDKVRLWEAMIPQMGYMALLRNLRNFDEAGLSDTVAAGVIARLTDPDAVAKSRQFPYRFLAAYEQVNSLRWGVALDRAIGLSLRNVPALDGRTLVLIDTSASMTSMGFSRKSTMTPEKAAAIFGVALAMRNLRNVDLYGFASGVFTHPIRSCSSLISEINKFVARTGEVGHGTEITYSLQKTLQPHHKRVFVISDMQAMDHGANEVVPANVDLYGVNLGGYGTTSLPAGMPHRHILGSLSDASFRVVPLLEAGEAGRWPWTV